MGTLNKMTRAVCEVTSYLCSFLTGLWVAAVFVLEFTPLVEQILLITGLGLMCTLGLIKYIYKGTYDE